MTKDVITCSPHTDIHECARMMSDHQIRRIPFVENVEIVWISASGDLAKAKIFVHEAGEVLSQIS